MATLNIYMTMQLGEFYRSLGIAKQAFLNNYIISIDHNENLITDVTSPTKLKSSRIAIAVNF